MEEQLISIETAILAKEKGFDEITRYYFNEYGMSKDSSSTSLYWYSDDGFCRRPTQSLLQKWLRDKHNIDIQILRNKPGYNEYKVEIYKTNNTNEYIYFTIKEKDGIYIKWFKTYEAALEKGLYQALTLIKE